MSDIATTAPADAGTGEGIASTFGQAGDTAPAGSVSTQGTGEEPRFGTADPSPEQPPQEESGLGWKSIQDAERDYKALQRAYTKSHQAMAQLGDLNQVQQERQILSQLREHPGFIDWVRQELAKEQTGANDPQTLRALEIVQNQVRQVAGEMVAPLYAAHVDQKVKTAFAEMDKEFGPEWQLLKPRMNELLQSWKRQGLVSPSVEQNFDYNFVKGLYGAAAAADPAYAARIYQKRLEQKQANTTTNQPGTASAAVASAPVNSMREAYALAKRQIGVS